MLCVYSKGYNESVVRRTLTNIEEILDFDFDTIKESII